LAGGSAHSGSIKGKHIKKVTRD